MFPGTRPTDSQPHQRSIRWRLELAAWKGLALVLSQLGHRRALRCGEMMGRLLPTLAPRRLQIARQDLERAIGSTTSATQIETIARGCLASLGGNLAELLWLSRAPRSTIDSLVEVDERSRRALQEAVERGRGVILVAMHFARWELMFLGFNLTGHRFTVVTHPLANPHLDRFLSAIRCRFGNSVVHTGNTRAMHGVLARGGTLLISMDHKSDARHAKVVQFLGQPTPLATGIARLARRHQATLLPIYCLPLAGGRLRIEIGPILDVGSGGDRRDEVEHITQRSADVLGDVIRRYPQYWMWSHKRLWSGADPSPQSPADLPRLA